MTGIERLRKLSETEMSLGYAGASSTLKSIADQIERERACDSDTAENVRLIVGGVVDEMERHALGHEDMEDSPVARWARELRKALGGRDDAKDVSMSAYDLLPQEDREAIAWVRGHGGLDAVNRSLQDAENRRVELFSALGVDTDTGWADAMTEMRRRLMPEGGWPRYEDGGMVLVGSDFADGLGETHTVTSIEFFEGCVELHWNPDEPGEFEYFHPGERVKRPAPKVLDADGVEIRVGDTVWHVHDLDKFTVTNPNNGENLSVTCKGEDGKEYCCYPRGLTHRAPVLAADGKPLREGETVWGTDSGTRYTVEKVTDELIPIKCRSEMGSTVSLYPSQLTHERPDSWERLDGDEKIEPSCDRKALLETAESIESYAELMTQCGVMTVPGVLRGFVSRIREACWAGADGEPMTVGEIGGSDGDR